MSKKTRINMGLNKAIQTLVDQARDGKLIRSETVMALKLAVQWEMVKHRIRGGEDYGTALSEVPMDAELQESDEEKEE